MVCLAPERSVLQDLQKLSPKAALQRKPEDTTKFEAFDTVIDHGVGGQLRPTRANLGESGVTNVYDRAVLLVTLRHDSSILEPPIGRHFSMRENLHQDQSN